MIYEKLTELIGHTPLLELTGFAGQQARLIVKLELFNPGGSIKDRVALSMIEDAEKKGLLKSGSTIIEPTSGNTGVGLAWVSKVKGYKVILTMPENMSLERRNLLRAYGAELELTPALEGMNGAIRRAEELKNEIAGSVILGQFVNPANPAIHEKITGEEIWEETDGKIDIFVAGVGTGGTVSGIGKSLKAHNPQIKVIAVEPESSAVLSTGISGKHKIQGIGAGFIPETYDGTVVDEIQMVSDEEAFESTAFLAKERGLLVGISSGAAFHAAYNLAKRADNSGKIIVALMPDTGERYLSTGIFG